MKNLFQLCIAVFLAFSFSVNAKETPFPEYSKKMTIVASCACNGLFSSCVGKGSCVCSCGFFSCSCSSDKQDTQKQVSNKPISISEKQFKNIELLADKLDEIGASKARVYLANIVESVRDSDMEKLQKSRAKYLKELEMLDMVSKSKINQFFRSIGAVEQI